MALVKICFLQRQHPSLQLLVLTILLGLWDFLLVFLLGPALAYNAGCRVACFTASGSFRRGRQGCPRPVTWRASQNRILVRHFVGDPARWHLFSFVGCCLQRLWYRSTRVFARRDAAHHSERSVTLGMLERIACLLVEYDGTDFSGAQLVPPPTRTVQGELEAAVMRLQRGSDCKGLFEPLLDAEGQLQKHAGVVARTDKGVHAFGQVVTVHVRANSSAPADKFASALNSRLPADLVVRAAAWVEQDPSFHPNLSARSKMYTYSVRTGIHRPALTRRNCWFVRGPPLDVILMQAAAAELVGIPRDFSAFRTKQKGHDECDVMCTITELAIEPCDADPNLITFYLRADRFLYRMCRNLVGVLVAVGRGKLALGDVGELLRSRDRRLGPDGAPACGLCLQWIDYGEDAPADAFRFPTRK